MVDFQSRDTSRGVDDGEDDAEETDETDETAGTAGTDGADGASGDDGSATDGRESATATSGPTETAAEPAPEPEPKQESEPAPERESEPEPTPSGTAGEAVSVAILVTDEEADAADAVAEALEGDHEVLGRDRRTGDLDSVQAAVDTFIDQPSVDAVVTLGGVGVGPTQVTVDAVEPLLDSELPGFGEMFRRRYEAVADSAALRSRAFAGIAGTTPVFCLPGDAEAARTAAEELLSPELDWLVSAASDV